MDFASVKAMAIPQGNAVALHINGVLVWRAGEEDVGPAYTNLVPLSTNADGSSIFNGTGYKTGYRLRSGGAEGSQTGGTVTGYIPVSAGDVMRIYDISGVTTSSSGTGINVYDSSYTHIGQAASNGAYGIFASTYSAYSWGNGGVNEGGGIFRWAVPPSASGVAYIRVTVNNYPATALGADLIVTVNQEIV